MAKEQPSIEQLGERLISAKKEHAAKSAAVSASRKAHDTALAEHDASIKTLRDADLALTAALNEAAASADAH